jgi:hypothetical protein
LAAGTGRAVLPFYQLPAGSLLVLCPRSKTTLFDSSINVLGLDDFPALGNDADTLVLYNAAGAVVHAVAYDKTWYAAAGKENGGWSLEMISAAAPCSGGLNWRAATAATGSTPGKLNSVATSGADTSLPDLLQAYMTDSLHATLYFSKAVDSLAAVDPAHYQLTPGPLHIVAATAVPPLFNTVQLQLPAPLQGIYTLRVKDITDCAGLPVRALDTAVLALPVMADS